MDSPVLCKTAIILVKMYAMHTCSNDKNCSSIYFSFNWCIQGTLVVIKMMTMNDEDDDDAMKMLTRTRRSII